MAEDTLIKASQRIGTDPTVQDHWAIFIRRHGRLKKPAVADWERAILEWNKTVAAEVDQDDMARVHRETGIRQDEVGQRGFRQQVIRLNSNDVSPKGRANLGLCLCSAGVPPAVWGASRTPIGPARGWRYLLEIKHSVSMYKSDMRQQPTSPKFCAIAAALLEAMGDTDADALSGMDLQREPYITKAIANGSFRCWIHRIRSRVADRS